MKIGRVIGLCGAAFILAGMSSAIGSAQIASSLSSLEFHSSNAGLNSSFAWAKQQALAYTRSGEGSIGPWYEAALPGRNAFCMRDVSHQTEGAAALGLFAANRNMLNRFATSAVPSRNWAGYWEIDGSGAPSTADYRSDDDFWFNLPANFDVLDAIVRMWRWTGDDFYQSDPRLQLFFRKTLTDYIAQWQLEPEAILTRPRIANQRLASGQFVASRGIPSYIEGPKNFVLGTDQLAAEYRAIRSYQEIAAQPEDKQLAARLQESADAIQHILETVGWSPQEGHFHGVIQQDLHGFGSADTFILYFDAAKDPNHVRGALDYVANPAYWQTINIEEESYVPTVLFRYGRADVAYRVLLDLSAPGKPRREYPEVSYGVIAAFISGAMGIEPAHAADAFDVQTLSQPIAKSEEMSLRSLRVKGNLVDVVHTGDAATRFVNREGAPLRWKAMFLGPEQSLSVDGKQVRAEHGITADGVQASWIVVKVPSGGSATVRRMARHAAQ
jgi:hypothetical protein